MRITLRTGTTYELGCFEFYNKRFFCTGTKVGDPEIYEFISSFDFKYLMISDVDGKSTFKSNKSSVNPILLQKNNEYNKNFKLENDRLRVGKDIDIEDYGPTAYNGRYSCLCELENLNIPEDIIFETFTISRPKVDHWLIDHDEEYGRLHRPLNSNAVPRLYCAMPFMDKDVFGGIIKIIHYVTKDYKHYFDINSLGRILNCDMGNLTGQNGFWRLNFFMKLAPAKGFIFCDKHFLAATRIEKTLEVSNHGSNWICKNAKEIPLKERFKRKYAFRFLYEYEKRFRWAISDVRKNEPYKTNYITTESGKKVRLPKPTREFMFKLIFSGETMAQFRLYRFENVDRAEIYSDPGYNGANLTNKIMHWKNEDSWYIDGTLDFTDPDEYIKFDGLTKNDLIKYVTQKYNATGRDDVYELFRNWIPEKFIRNLHFFNIKMNRSGNKIKEDQWKNCGALNPGFIRFYHFDDEYIFGTYVSLMGILATFGLHHTIARKMVVDNEWDDEALDVIPCLKDYPVHRLKVNEFGMITNDTYPIPCRDREYPKQLNTIVISVSDALHFINNGLYRNQDIHNLYWRRNANELFTAFPEINIGPKIIGHNINELYSNIPKLRI